MYIHLQLEYQAFLRGREEGILEGEGGNTKSSPLRLSILFFAPETPETWAVIFSQESNLSKLLSP